MFPGITDVAVDRVGIAPGRCACSPVSSRRRGSC